MTPTVASRPDEVDTERCPHCGRRHPRDRRYVAATLCDDCRDRHCRAKRWVEADALELIELCARIGVRKRFCQNDRPPGFGDVGLAGRTAANPLPPGGLFITGPVGSHKSHLLCARAVHSARRGFSTRVVTWGEFCLEVRATYSPVATETERDVLERYGQLDYLGLDDLGVGREDRQESEASLRLAHVLLNRRYESCQTTDVTSNLTPDELAARFDERIARRLGEMCTVYPMLLGDRWGKPEATHPGSRPRGD